MQFDFEKLKDKDSLFHVLFLKHCKSDVSLSQFLMEHHFSLATFKNYVLQYFAKPSSQQIVFLNEIEFSNLTRYWFKPVPPHILISIYDSVSSYCTIEFVFLLYNFWIYIMLKQLQLDTVLHAMTSQLDKYKMAFAKTFQVTHSNANLALSILKPFSKSMEEYELETVEEVLRVVC